MEHREHIDNLLARLQAAVCQADSPQVEALLYELFCAAPGYDGFRAFVFDGLLSIITTSPICSTQNGIDALFYIWGSLDAYSVPDLRLIAESLEKSLPSFTCKACHMYARDIIEQVNDRLRVMCEK